MIDPSHPTNRPKLILFLLVTLAVLGALEWAGPLRVIQDSDKVHFLPIALLIDLYAVWFAWNGKWPRGVARIAKIFPVLGLVWVVYGILVAFHIVNAGASYDERLLDVAQSLVGTLTGIGSMGWLWIMRWVCERDVPIVSK